jgi:serine/threonine protein kinase
VAFDIGTRLGFYEIGELAGRGGMGEVYRARDSRLKRTVAIKILPAPFAADSDRVRRFEQEAETLAALSHPNIAAIHAIEEAGGTRFLVLEFVEGETLAQRLARGPLDAREATAIALQICSALAAAHDRGIVHRDLKPANIKIAPGGQVKLLDFGLARMFAAEASAGDLSQSPTVTAASGGREIAGTAAYMAPEQARGKPVDKRADMWALGCVLYETLTARPLFHGETVTDILAAIVTQEPRLEALPAATPAPLRWVIERCLQKDPNARLRDAADAAALAGSGLTAAGDARARTRRWLPAAAAAAAALATGALAWLWPSKRTPRTCRRSASILPQPARRWRNRWPCRPTAGASSMRRWAGRAEPSCGCARSTIPSRKRSRAPTPPAAAGGSPRGRRTGDRSPSSRTGN